MNTPAPLLPLNLSPYSRINQVPLGKVQKAVHRVFCQFGLPLAMRFDNGAPFADTHRQITPQLALWLVGLGVKLIYNDPYKAQQNAKVERHQGTLGNWVDPQRCLNYEQFVKRLAFARQTQWQSYPTRMLNGKTRLQVYPALKYSGRSYQHDTFQMERVKKHLRQFQWIRKISSKGAACIYNAYYQVGYKYRNQLVIVIYEEQSHQWQFWDTAKEKLLNQLPITNIIRQRLLNLP